MPAPVRSTSIAARSVRVELERGDVDAIARVLAAEAQLAEHVVAQAGGEEAHAVQRAERRAERAAGRGRRPRRAAARHRPRARASVSRAIGGDASVRRLQQRCPAAACRGERPALGSRGRARPSRVRVPRSVAADRRPFGPPSAPHAAPSLPARPPARSRARGRRSPRASSAAPSASSDARPSEVEQRGARRVGEGAQHVCRRPRSATAGCCRRTAPSSRTRRRSAARRARVRRPRRRAAPAGGAGRGDGRRRQRDLAPVRGQLVEVGVEAAGAGRRAERDPAHGVGHHRSAERDVRRQLRPGRDRLLDLDHRRRRAVGEARRVEDPEHVRAPSAWSSARSARPR